MKKIYVSINTKKTLRKIKELLSLKVSENGLLV